jgi:hypothetical protein
MTDERRGKDKLETKLCNEGSVVKISNTCHMIAPFRKERQADIIIKAVPIGLLHRRPKQFYRRQANA